MDTLPALGPPGPLGLWPARADAEDVEEVRLGEDAAASLAASMSWRRV